MNQEEVYRDFSLKCGSVSGSFLSFCVAIVKYIIIPLALITLIDKVGASILGSFSSGTLDFGVILQEFTIYIRKFMVYSIPLLFLSIFIGYYPKGNYARIPFEFISAVYLAFILLLFTNGGYLDLHLDGSSLGIAELESADVTLVVTSFVYILATISIAKGFLAFAEFADCRKKYLKNLAKKLNSKQNIDIADLMDEDDDEFTYEYIDEEPEEEVEEEEEEFEQETPTKTKVEDDEDILEDPVKLKQKEE